MQLDACITRLREQREIIVQLFAAIPAERVAWKPTPSDWSALEVINHLADEEHGDFGARLGSTLAVPQEPWPPTDPEGWVVERGYNQRDPQQSLQRFIDEREQALTWLSTLAGADWNTIYQHPYRPISAGDLLAAWVAHDVLHMRQLVELHWACVNDLVAPYAVDYAGDW